MVYVSLALYIAGLCITGPRYRWSICQWPYISLVYVSLALYIAGLCITGPIYRWSMYLTLLLLFSSACTDRRRGGTQLSVSSKAGGLEDGHPLSSEGSPIYRWPMCHWPMCHWSYVSLVLCVSGPMCQWSYVSLTYVSMALCVTVTYATGTMCHWPYCG